MNETERKTQLHAGIDGGATQTRCVIAGTDCIIRGMAESGPSNPLRVGVESAVREITSAVKRAAGECDIEPDKLHMACFGVAGTRDEEVRETLLCGLRESLETSRLTVETDARIAFAAAIPEGFGVISLSGTGSVTYGIDLKGNSLYADGLGPLLGDEGSAYQVGLEGLRCVARQLDGRGPATRFTETVLDALGVYDLDSLRRLASKDGLDAVTIASLAPLILSAFGEGDPEALRIGKMASSSIAKAIGSVAKALDFSGERFRVALCGGLLEKQNAFRKEVVERISGHIPDAMPGVPFLPPVFGALALSMAGSDSNRLRECLLTLKARGRVDGPDRN